MKHEKPKTLAKGHEANLDTIIRAARDGRLALVECRDRATGQPCAVLSAISDAGNGAFDIVPFARMFDGNPYDQLDPPAPGGGFYSKETSEKVQRDEG